MNVIITNINPDSTGLATCDQCKSTKQFNQLTSESSDTTNHWIIPDEWTYRQDGKLFCSQNCSNKLK